LGTNAELAAYKQMGWVVAIADVFFPADPTVNIPSYHSRVMEPCKNVTIVVPFLCDN
jgi:hypothetical protein